MPSDQHPKSNLHANYCIQFDAIPSQLTERPQWVLWREVERKGSLTKVPYQCDGITEAKSDDRTTWASFEAVREAYDPDRHSGIGFVLSEDDPFFGVDLDSCIRPDGKLMPWADEVLNCLTTYSEVSPSGVGLKLIGIGDLATTKTGRTFRKGLTPAVDGKMPEIAMWRCGRYFTITGETWGSNRIYDCPKVNELFERLFGKSDTAKPIDNHESNSKTDDRGRLALAAMCRMEMVDANDGSRRLYAAACRAVGWDLSESESLHAIRTYAMANPFPRQWTDDEIVHRIRDAGSDVERGGELNDYRAWRDRGGEQSNIGATKVWEDPIPVDRPDVPAFPLGVLPEPLRSWVSATSEATQTPSELAGLLALAVCSGAVARRVEVSAGRGWREPINLFVAVLLDPANRKSAVFRSAMAPLRAIEAEMIEEAGPDIARAQAERRMKESQSKDAEKKASKGDEQARHEALQLAEELSAEPVPALPKLLVDDATAEAIELALAAQGGRLIVAGAEGGLFDVMAGRYSSGVGNLDAFLKGHAGDDLRVDRVIRGSVIVDRCCLTLAYAVQPEVIRGLADKPSFRGRGLIGRFLYAIPETTLGRRSIDPEPVPYEVAQQYENLVRRLAAIPESFNSPWILSMSSEASMRLKSWASEVEPMLGDEGRLASMRDWGGKLVGLTARLAGVLHLVTTESSDPCSVAISRESIEAAITLARWAVPHAEAVISLMAGGDGSVDDASYVLRWLRGEAKAEVSRREIHSHGRARFDGDPERLTQALAVLVERGWIRAIDDGKKGPGRPSERYEVHPCVSVPVKCSVPFWVGDDTVAPASSGRVMGVI